MLGLPKDADRGFGQRYRHAAQGQPAQPPASGGDDVVRFLQGLAALGERMVMVLDLDKLGGP